MDDYCNGIALATGYMANDAQKPYLVVRNLDPWYANQIATATGGTTYKSMHNIGRDGKPQFVIKARNINSLPPLSEIQSPHDFCRAYIEIHGVLDMVEEKKHDGSKLKRPRLRIYGSEEIIEYINNVLPAKNKKVQYITNKISNKYIGSTCAIYYQSAREISDILDWIDGYPKNETVWGKWEQILTYRR